MKALSLFGVLLLARTLTLLGRDVALSVWAPVAYLWQDLLVVLLFAVLERATGRRPWIAWVVYGAMGLYVALNLPLVRLVPSPMTWPRLRATQGTLADSIRHHLTAENLILIGLVLGTTVALPLLLRRVRARSRVSVGLTMAATVLVAGGPFAARQVDTAGLERNVFLVLFETALPRMAAEALNADWRASPNPDREPAAPSGDGGDLSRFKGAAQGRNVALILLESTGAQYLRPYGAALDPMPNLTTLVGQAILFENAYAVYPESIKGLLSVLCSRYPAFDASPEACARVGTPALAERLAASGYRTALFHSGRFAYLGMEEVVRHRGFQTLADAGDIGGNHRSSFGVDDAATVRRMLEWIDSLPAGEKFFITYLPVAGHHPYSAPESGPFPQREEIDRYRNALHYGDASLAELFRGLKARGLFQNMLFVILGDHSEAFGQHEGNFGHTLFVYDENVRVPFFVVAPGLIREQVRVQRTASLIDSAPTILDLLGLPVPGGYQGMSLLQSRRQMALFYTDYSLGLLGLRDGRWKFIYELESGRSRLFDLAKDARETENFATQRPDRAQAYGEHLRRWAAAQRNLILHRTGDGACSER